MTDLLIDPRFRTPTRQRDDIDDEVESLMLLLARAEHPHERAVLVEEVVLVAIPLADAIARRYAGRGIETDDLVQVARTALVKSVHRYRPGTGPGFSAFAAPTVSGEVKRWFRDHGWAVRPPRRVQELRAQVVAEEERMRRLLSRDPTTDELSRALGVTARDVDEVRLSSASYHADSLDAVSPAGTTLSERLVTASHTESLEQRDALGWAISRLTVRQRLILRLRFVEERTQQQIGDELGVSQMQVSRLLSTLLERLRADLAADLDDSRSTADVRMAV